jgi:hypothetical protein
MFDIEKVNDRIPFPTTIQSNARLVLIFSASTSNWIADRTKGLIHASCREGPEVVVVRDVLVDNLNSDDSTKPKLREMNLRNSTQSRAYYAYLCFQQLAKLRMHKFGDALISLVRLGSKWEPPNYNLDMLFCELYKPVIIYTGNGSCF